MSEPRPRVLRRDEKLFEAPAAPMPIDLAASLERPCTHCGKPVAACEVAWCFKCNRYTTKPKEKA